MKGSAGMTLVEMALVLVLIALMSGFAVARMGSLTVLRQKSSIRKFANTWELMYHHAAARGHSLRFVLDLNTNSYYVRRELPADSTTSRQVDHLAGLRTRGEQERRAAEEEELGSLQDEFKQEDVREGEALENIFFQQFFQDPEGPVKLAHPVEFPSLAETQALPDGVRLRDVVVGGREVTEGVTFIRFSGSGAADFAVVHFELEEQVLTLVANPATGEVVIHEDDLKFDWVLGEDKPA